MPVSDFIEILAIDQTVDEASGPVRGQYVVFRIVFTKLDQLRKKTAPKGPAKIVATESEPLKVVEICYETDAPIELFGLNY